MTAHRRNDNTGPIHGAIGGWSWDVFDALPRPVRDFLNYTPINLSTDPFYDALAIYGWSIARLLSEAYIAQAQQLKAENPLVWSPDYPCLPLSSLIDSPLSNDTQASRGSGARRARAARRSQREHKTSPSPECKPTSMRKNPSPST